jgi:hypothetical protein
MFHNIIANIDGVELYGIVSICIFFTFFIGMLVWAGTLRKNHLKAMADLPLQDGSQPGPASKTIPS